MLRIAGCPIVQPQPISTVSRRAGSHPGEVLRLRLEPPIPFGQYDPALRAAGPEMRCRTQPRGVIQRAGGTRSASRVVGSGFGPLQIHVPQSGQTHRVTVRPLSALRWSERGWVPAKWKAVPATTSAIENALPVRG